MDSVHLDFPGKSDVKHQKVTTSSLGSVNNTFSFHLSLQSAKNVPRCDVKVASGDSTGSATTLRPIMVRLARICLFDGKKFVGNSHVIAALSQQAKQKRKSIFHPRFTTTIDGDNSTNVVPADQTWKFDCKNNNDVIVRCTMPDTMKRNSGEMYIYIELNASFDFNDSDKALFKDYSQKTRAGQIDEICCCWGFMPVTFESFVTGTSRHSTIKGRGKELRVPLSVGRLKVPSDVERRKLLGTSSSISLCERASIAETCHFAC